MHSQLPGLKSNGQQNPEAMSQSTKTKGARGLQVNDRVEDALLLLERTKEKLQKWKEQCHNNY